MIPNEIAALMTLIYPDWRDLDNNEPIDKETIRDVRAAALRIHEAGYCRLNPAACESERPPQYTLIGHICLD